MLAPASTAPAPLRLDLGEAAEKHAQRVQERARWFEQEAEAMMSRVAATPHATFWTKEERAALEEVRQETEARAAVWRAASAS